MIIGKSKVPRGGERSKLWLMMMMKIDDNHDKMMIMMIVLNENNEEQRRRHGQWAGLRVSRKPLLKQGA